MCSTPNTTQYAHSKFLSPAPRPSTSFNNKTVELHGRMKTAPLSINSLFSALKHKKCKCTYNEFFSTKKKM